MGSTDLIEPIVTTLKNCSSGLLSLNRSTEDDFLTLGTHLKGVSGQCGEVSRMAKSTADLIDGEEMEGHVNAIQDLLDQMDRQLKASRSDLGRSSETIKGILEGMDSLIVSLNGFAGIVKRLSMLSISTKIETSRLEDSDGSFGSLAQDIAMLSTTIGSKSGYMRHAVDSLRAVISDTLSKASAFDTSENVRTQALLGEIIQSLSYLREKHTLSSRTVGFIAERSDEISSAVGEIVSSLQFHDITRQQIEHVAEAIDELSDKMSPLTAEEGTLSKLTDLCIGELCTIQVKQLSSAQHELVSAVDATLNNLGRISSNVADILKEVATLTGATGSAGSSFLSRLRAEVVRIISSLKENSEASSHLAEAVARVATTTRELSGFVTGVEDVGEQMELIALNARVKAARAGTEGAALSVLAEATKSLSEDSRRRTSFMSTILHRVGAVAEEMGEVEARGGENLRLDDATDKLGALLDRLGDFDGRVSALVGPLERSSNSLETEIRNLVSGTTVQQRTEDLLGKVIPDLNEVIRASRGFGSPQPVRKDAEYLRLLEGRYTMHKERSVHQSVFQINTPNTSPHEKTDGGFGDNVELF